MAVCAKDNRSATDFGLNSTTRLRQSRAAGEPICSLNSAINRKVSAWRGLYPRARRRQSRAVLVLDFSMYRRAWGRGWGRGGGEGGEGGAEARRAVRGGG